MQVIPDAPAGEAGIVKPMPTAESSVLQQPQAQRWRILMLLNGFRLALAVLLLLQLQIPQTMTVIDPPRFLLCLIGYLG